MLSHDEWLQSHHTIELLRWLEKHREEWTQQCLAAASCETRNYAAESAGRVACARATLAKIRERKPNDESV